MIRKNENIEYIKFLTDICALCKGWYDENKYPTLLKALNEYYHKEYGNENFEISKDFALQLFIYPLVTEIINRNPKMVKYIFNPAIEEFDNTQNMSIHDIMYARCLALIHNTKKDIFDIPDDVLKGQYNII